MNSRKWRAIEVEVEIEIRAPNYGSYAESVGSKMIRDRTCVRTTLFPFSSAPIRNSIRVIRIQYM